MDKKQFKRLLRKYLGNKLDGTGRQRVDEWFDSFGYELDIEPFRDDEKVDRIQQSLKERLDAYTAIKKPARRIIRWLPMAAALFVVVFAGWWVWREQIPSARVAVGTGRSVMYDTLRTERGKMKRVVLPDQSVVWLNSHTQLRYSAADFSGNRELFIDRGEAFFEVFKDPKKPFVVHSEAIRTTVLGTAFNVKNYPELDYIAVQVKTGKVSVSTASDQLLDTVSAGHGLRYHKAENSAVAYNNFASDAGSWTEGRTVLNDATFAELALVLYNRFGVTLQTQLPQAANFRYTIMIQQQTPLEETLRLICDVHQTNFRRKNNEITMY